MSELIGGGDDPRSDEELLQAYQSDADDNGEAWTAIYLRYRGMVRHRLEAEGLGPPEAEHRVGAVFIRVLNAEGETRPLRQMLEEEAAVVAQLPEWNP